MRKLLLILLLLFPVHGAWAEIFLKTNDFIIFKTKGKDFGKHKWIKGEGQLKPHFYMVQSLKDDAIAWCNTMNKNTYFFRTHLQVANYGFGGFAPWGDIDRYKYWKWRFWCANDIKSAINLLRSDNVNKKVFSSELPLIGGQKHGHMYTKLYLETNEKPYSNFDLDYLAVVKATKLVDVEIWEREQKQNVAKKKEEEKIAKAKLEEEERIAEAKRKEEEKRKAEARKQKEEEKQIAESKNKEDNYNRKTKPKKKSENYDTQKAILKDLSKFYKYGVGTGFFINKKGNIVSNSHVAGNQCGMVVARKKGKYYVLNLMAYDKINDLAILESKLKPQDFFTIASKDANLTEKIFAVGFPFGDRFSSKIKTTSGVVSSLAGIGDNYSHMQIDASVQRGNSGGAVINENGIAVGVVVEKINWKYVIEETGGLPENINFAIKSSILTTFLEANDIEFKKSNLFSKMTSTKQLSKKAQNSSLFLICAITKDTHDAMDDRNKASLVDYKF